MPFHRNQVVRRSPSRDGLSLLSDLLESTFRSFSRPVLHAAARVVQEMGRSRAAAYSLGVCDIDEGTQIHAYSENVDSADSDLNDISQAEASRKALPLSNGTGGKDTITSLLASLMEVVRTTVACECVYVRGMVIKALIWMQNPHESFEELGAIIASELSDPAWPSSLLNDILLYMLGSRPLQLWQSHYLKLQEFLLPKSLERLMLMCCNFYGKHALSELDLVGSTQVWRQSR